MPYNPEIHNRQSIRLKGYDYTQEGLYYITICVKDRKCFFGNIENGKMKLNALGTVADKYWMEIPNHFPQFRLHEHIVMPNHVHGIIEIVGPRHVDGPRHGVGICHGKSQYDNTENTAGQRHDDGPRHIVGTCHGMSLRQPPIPHHRHFSKPISGSVSTIINQYKSSVKRWCNKNHFENFQWQSRFYDHIIRNPQSFENIANYILNNPAKWQEDTFYNTQTNHL